MKDTLLTTCAFVAAAAFFAGLTAVWFPVNTPGPMDAKSVADAGRAPVVVVHQ